MNVHFRVAGVRLRGTQAPGAKFFFVLITSSQCLLEAPQKVTFFEVVKVHFAWQAWGFVAFRRKVVFSHLFPLARCALLCL